MGNYGGDLANLTNLLPENLAGLESSLEGLDMNSPEAQQALEELLAAEADLLLAQELGMGAGQGSDNAEDPGVVRRTICKFWLEGTCAKQEGQCGFAHGEHELGTRGPSQQKIQTPCRFFAQGACQK